MLLAPDAHNQSLCPIWDGVNLGDIPTTPPEVISPAGNRYYSSRAGGPFRLMQSGAELLALDAQLVQSREALLPAGQQANLSYWIYQHNLKHHLLDELTDYDCLDTGPFQNWMDDRRDRVLELDETWVVDHRDRKPSFLDRELTYLRELIRSNDADEQPYEDLLQAAGGCRNARDLAELRRHTVDKGWTGSNKPGSEGTSPYQINASARIHVEEQLREADQPLHKQVFVAMWFDDSMLEAYERGIEPAICAAGYKPLRIDREHYVGPVADKIVAEIHKSRFVVADLTGRSESGAPGGVYYEAGYAHALDIPVIYTVRQDRKGTVHFDVNHLNRIEWKDVPDLRKQLQELIVKVFERGPHNPATARVVD